MLLTLGIGVALLFPDGPGIRVGEYDLGGVSERDVIAQVGFDVSQDPEILAEQRRVAERAVPATFIYQPDVSSSVAGAIEAFFAKVDSGAAAGGATGVTGALSMASLEASADEITLLTDPETSARLRRTAASGAREFLSRGSHHSGGRVDPGGFGANHPGRCRADYQSSRGAVGPATTTTVCSRAWMTRSNPSC